MGVVELISKGFGIAAKSKNLLLVLFAFGFVWNLINIPFTSQIQQQPSNAGASVMVVILSVIFIAISIYMQAGSLTYIRDLIKTGKADLAQFKTGGSKYYLRILGISAIVGLFMVILSILAALAILLGGENPSIISIIIAIVIAVVGFTGVLMVFLTPYILIVDETKVMEALRKSISLVRSNFLQVLAIGVLLLLIGFGVGVLLGVVFGLLGTFLKGIVSQVVFGLLSSMLNAFLGLVVTGTFMSYYLGHRTGGSGA